MLRVIAVNYYTSSIAQPFLNSFLDQDYKNWEIYIVDNSNDDAELEKLFDLSNDPRIKIINPKKNLGFLPGAAFIYDNYIDGVLEEDDLVVVSNLDLYLDTTKEVKKLIDINSKSKGVGVFAPDIVSLKRGDHQNPMMISRPTKKSMLLRKVMFYNTLTAQFTTSLDIYTASLRSKPSKQKAPLDAKNIYAPHGSFMIFTADFFRKGGNFNYEMFLFDEEIFVAEQCKELGLIVKFIPSVKVMHITNATFGTKRNKKILQYKVDATKNTYNRLFD